MSESGTDKTSKRSQRNLRQRRTKAVADLQRAEAPELTDGSNVEGTQTAALADQPSGKPKIREQDITGLKYFDQLAPLLQCLHEDACQRDTAGNRELHYDQYCMLILLFLFNPIVTSLRGIQQASELKKVQSKLGCSRASLGSLSEATSVFNPELLKEIIAELGEQLQPIAADSRLKDIQQTVTLVDEHMLGCRKLLSRDAEGIEIQTYCAIIACMLISLWTGRKPTLRTYEMICFYFCGMASEEELMKHIEKLKPQIA